MSPKAKRPRNVVNPPTGKAPRFADNPERFYDQRISWHLGHLDLGGPFCPSAIGANGVSVVVEKLRSFETRTWQEILNGSQNHAIAIENLAREAQRRLSELELDDINELISLRFSGAERVWGIRDQAILRVIWWDPNHQVCPSPKRHT